MKNLKPIQQIVAQMLLVFCAFYSFMYSLSLAIDASNHLMRSETELFKAHYCSSMFLGFIGGVSILIWDSVRQGK